MPKVDNGDTGSRRSVAVEFVRCGCGEEYGHTINLLDGKPIWTPPKAKRGATCKHPPADAEMLVNGQWIKSGDPIPEEGS